MVKIRLRRIGRKKLPIYQIVAADARARRDGRFLEVLGRYEPTRKPHQLTFNRERLMYWLSVGAQPTDTAKALIRRTGMLYENYMRIKGKSEEEIGTEMETWQQRNDSRLKRGLDRKAIRRKRKKEAEAKEKESAG
ncbi:ribosomal protein S16 [Chloroherpeton thalassium ATCC 35110]|uniref:Small ribosomal subunit protein bS16 n=1 Tax=Chloroherpeton thalassium (strain ATCC 35110 / GB-78) TaxID=517418 RepID=RS16_CHLT3|nr:30S ribosomal protein S16 [Chloroherpeton thalassium]B3QXJ8.1 RecName: Full=Small ribosomal subunit protein bS16; AltName: Full=30S ribosomal protein S16 [Chloroherpeton thalassium ATCC 35110]ACF14913.1 ribosomal protein S16 [Chloroherpeton thalassium ATCC 35110]